MECPGQCVALPPLGFDGPALLWVGPTAEVLFEGAPYSMPPEATNVPGTLFLYEDRLRIIAGRYEASHRRRTKDEPVIAAELPDRIDEIDHCAMTPEQVGLYQAVIDRVPRLVPRPPRRAAV